MDMGGPSLPGTVPPGQVVLGCLMKLAEQEPDEQTSEFLP